MLLASIILFPIVAFAVLLSFNQARFIMPARVNAVPVPDTALDYELLGMKTPDGNTIQGILFRPAAPSPTLVLAFPGNMHNPIGFAQYLKTEVFAGQNVAIAAFSYRGYPNGITSPSTGMPSQKALFADSELIYDTLVNRLQPAQVKAVGYSLGTAVATHLATARPLNRLALVAPVASVRRIAQERYPWLPVRLLLRHPFATEDIIASIKVPTTIIYSPTDGLIPERHVTEILHDANPSIPLIAVPDTNHVTLAISPQLPNLLKEALAVETPR
ncbi:MAG: hypothetical protein DI585_05290 [Pseudomonas fluorescens]|nr:MAG: hypothetical protein DI585_05290 [Pseudomonas fluorescens]